MTEFQKRRCAFFTRYFYTYAWKPSGSLINFYLNSLKFDLTLEAEGYRNYNKMILKESERIFKKRAMGYIK